MIKHILKNAGLLLFSVAFVLTGAIVWAQELPDTPAFFFQAEDGIRDKLETGVQTCALPILHPGEFVLASTYEAVTLPDDVAARLEGKSSLGRLGLLTHSTAGFIDPGFSGHVTLELSNVATLPIKLWPGMKIGQLCFFRLSSPSEHPYGSEKYGSRYQGQRGPTPSRSHLSFHRTSI